MFSQYINSSHPSLLLKPCLFLQPEAEWRSADPTWEVPVGHTAHDLTWEPGASVVASVLDLTIVVADTTTIMPTMTNTARVHRRTLVGDMAMSSGGDRASLWQKAVGVMSKWVSEVVWWSGHIYIYILLSIGIILFSSWLSIAGHVSVQAYDR